MAEFNGVTITKAGRTVLAKAIAGKPLKFSRVSCGDGTLTENQDIYEFEGLINELHSLKIFTCEVGHNADGTLSPGVAELRAGFDNKNLKTGFYIREVGVFAEDPDTGEEVLYGYCNSGDKCGYMPEYGGSDVVEFLYKFYVVIDQAQNVTAISASGIVYVTQSELNAIFDESATIKEFWTRTEGDNRKFRPVGVSQARVTIMGIEDLGVIQKQLDEVSEAAIQNAVTFQNDIDDVKSNAITNHEKLDGLQGGDENEHYHLNKKEISNLQDLIRNCLDVVSHRILHETLAGLLGGQDNEHYHLSKEERNKLLELLQNLVPNNEVEINHETLKNLQGAMRWAAIII